LDQLHELGWSPYFAATFDDPGTEPARVAEEHKGLYRIRTGDREIAAEITGRMRHEATARTDLPAVGDWVAAEVRSDRATIRRVLPRRTALLRKAADRAATAQILAANVDTVFLVTSLNREFNLRRLERWLTLVWDSGARPVVLLTKLDLCDEPEGVRADAESVAFGVDVHALSAKTGAGMDALDAYLAPGHTGALIGSSGVGKSTLINRLCGAAVQTVREIREDDAHGRHTTTHRQLLCLPGRGTMIDTPGMREVALWDGDGVAEVFEDIEQVAASCRFRDCSHSGEPGCAVEASIDAARVESYKKLQRELEHVERRHSLREQANAKARWKAMTKASRNRPQPKRGS